MDATTLLLIGAMGSDVNAQWEVNAEYLPCAAEDMGVEYVSGNTHALGRLEDGSIFSVFAPEGLVILRAYCNPGTYEPIIPDGLLISFETPTERESGEPVQCDIPSYRLRMTFGPYSTELGLRACDEYGRCSAEGVVYAPNN